ncbi:MAG TPA: HEPN domain-containing protein [Geminicoccaceae bacterium]|jgi:HEPN domain-containing protein|nr:HEPN domain-containing protein [Geminicoccaceae bacterium]
MSGADPRKQTREAEQWFDAAAEDLRLVQAALGLEPPSYAGGTFHSQQAAEKIVKGLLVARARRLTRTHDLARLTDQCLKDWPDLRRELELCRPLSQWHIQFRYPRPDQIAESPPSIAEIAGIAAELESFLSAARAAAGRPSAEAAPGTTTDGA